jgi:hypothetical protein
MPSHGPFTWRVRPQGKRNGRPPLFSWSKRNSAILFTQFWTPTDVVDNNVAVGSCKVQINFLYIFRSLTCLNFSLYLPDFIRYSTACHRSFRNLVGIVFDFIFWFCFSSSFFYSSSIKMAPCSLSVSSLCLGRSIPLS